MSNTKGIKTDYFSDFNDDAENASDAQSEKGAEKEDFASLLKDSLKNTSKKLKVGDKIYGKILVLGKEDVYVSTPSRHEGVLPYRELLEADGTCPFNVGDVIELYVAQVRGEEIRLAKKLGDRGSADNLEDAFDMMLPVQGRVVEVCKGGVRVNVEGKLAFCPIGQLDTKHVETGDEYIGKSFEFQITQFSEGGRNIVVSRKKLLKEEQELKAGSFLEETKDGSIIPGKVVRLEKFGAFVEVAPGVDGLVHISEIAWSRIGDPSEVLQSGQEVMVKLVKREVIGGRIKLSLSIKQANEADKPKPGVTDKTAAIGKYSVGQIIEGKVQRKEVYGIFVSLDGDSANDSAASVSAKAAPAKDTSRRGGVSGLLHKSKTFDRPEFQFEKLKVGDKVTVQIAEVNAADGKISLDVPKDPNADDWKSHQQTTGSFGTLGDKLKNAMKKK